MQEHDAQEILTPDESEQIHIVKGTVPEKRQRADDIVLTQCMLCVILVLLCFGLHWLKPEWQQMLLSSYMEYREAAPVAWLDKLLQAVRDWMAQ